MQDLKSLGGTPEFKLGNREVAFLVGALFVVMVVVFGLGVMVGKRLYGQLPVDTASNQPNPPRTNTSVIEPDRTTPHPVATAEKYTYYELKNDNKPEPTATGEAKVSQPLPGTSGSITADSSITKDPPKDEWKFSIQVASLRSKTNTDKYIKKLRGKGIDAWTFTYVSKKTGKTWHVVRVGHYKTREEAQEQHEVFKLTKLVGEDSVIIAR